jgi:phosphotransferase family enzyme
VTLVLCTADGAVLGSLAPFDVPSPWWQQVDEVVASAREVHGVDVTVLRLVDAERAGPQQGGDVTYLAQVETAPRAPLTPWPGRLTEVEPLRQSWANPGGPAADLAWADHELAALDVVRSGQAQQVRTWNLSSIWRLPLAGEVRSSAAWLKVVTPFFQHEGALLSLLQGEGVPRLLALDGPRMLFEEIAGDDQYGAPAGTLVPVIRMLVGLQSEWADRLPELIDVGLPDWRAGALTTLAADVAERTADQLTASERRALDRLLGVLPARFAAIDDCAIPSSLVHGDFHPGNIRGVPGHLVLLDWGDSSIGHPMLDQTAFLERLAVGDRRTAQQAWTDAWHRARPGCDPTRAAALLRPVAAVRQAVIYRRFLDNIEPDERVYHRDDPAIWLRRAAEAG